MAAPLFALLDSGAEVAGGIATFVGTVIATIAVALIREFRQKKEAMDRMRSVPPSLPSSNRGGAMATDDSDTAPQRGVTDAEVIARLRGALERSERDNRALRDSLADKRLVDGDFAKMQARILEAERELEHWKKLAEERGEKLKSAESGHYTPVVVPEEIVTSPPPRLPKGIREEYEPTTAPTPVPGFKRRP